MRKISVLLLALLVVSICGCGGKKIDLDEYEQLNEIYYARVDLEEEVPTIYLYCADDEPIKQWILIQNVLSAHGDLYIETNHIELDFCIHFDAEGESFIYDEREYTGLDDEAFMEKLPPLMAKYLSEEGFYLLPTEAEQAELEQNIREKIIDPIKEKYIDVE
nr:hypothetical protein [uncultured Blautia sp.]